MYYAHNRVACACVHLRRHLAPIFAAKTKPKKKAGRREPLKKKKRSRAAASEEAQTFQQVQRGGHQRGGGEEWQGGLYSMRAHGEEGEECLAEGSCMPWHSTPRGQGGDGHLYSQ
jgi:hypothetical protein